jgi:outer membrane protein assembly factor BamB
MKPKRFYLLALLILTSLLLSSCGQSVTTTSWPGVTSDQDTIYVSYQTAVFAVNSKDGSMIWRYPAKAENSKVFYAAPVVSDGSVVVGSYNNTLYRLNAKTGDEVKTFTDAKGKFIGSAVQAGDLTLAPSADKNLYALTGDTQLKWKYTAGNGLWVTPVVDTKNAYQVSMDHFLYAIDLANGNLVWKTDLGGAAVNAPSLSQDGVLYVGTLNNEVVAVKASDGAVVWRYKASNAVWSQPAIANNEVIFGDLNGYVYALDAAKGTEKWKTQLTGAVIGGGAVMPNGIVFATDQGNFQAFDFNGGKLWARTINGKLYSNLSYTNGLIVAGVVGGDKLLMTFDANGNEGWSFAIPK